MNRPVTIVLLFLAANAAAQPRLGVWKNYTDMKSVRSVTVQGGTVWAATGGGVFSVDTATTLVHSYNNSDGLTSNDCRALAMFRDGRIWIGAADGSVNVFNPADGSVQDIGDLRSSSATSKVVHQLLVSGDTVYIAWDHALSVFRTQRWEFGDSYASFGFVSQPKVTAVALQGRRIWVGTTAGIASASSSDPNLSAPTAWTIYGAVGGPTAAGLVLGVLHDTLVVGTSSGASFFDGVAFVPLPAFAGRAVEDIETVNGQLLLASMSGGDCRIDVLSSVLAPFQSSLSLPGTSVTAVGEGGASIWIGTDTAGVRRLVGPSSSFVAPNGPNSNSFISLAVDENGGLWAASGTDPNGKGFYRFRPDLPTGLQWKNFTVARVPAIVTNYYYKVSAGQNGTMWLSSWGHGLLQMVGDSVRRIIDASTTPSLSSAVPQNPNYVVPGSVVYDPEGTPWVDVRTAVDGRHLAKMVSDSVFVYFQNQANPFEGLFQNMVIDHLGTKWLGNSEPSDKKDHGLYFFNEAGIVSGTSLTSGWGFLSTNDGLKSNSILSLAVDRDGDVWVGLDLGVAIITNPAYPSSGRSLAYPLQQQSIQCIAVDGINNKWVGTKEGAWVISPDGTLLLAQYTVASTGGQLVDNDVRSIAIDQKRGIVYFGTEQGLSSLQIAAVEPRSDFGTLALSPNPFQLPSSQPLMIQGLAGSAMIKVITSSGRLVREFAAQGGGRAFWDGRDTHGNTVASGIYFLVAYTADGSEVTTGKVAVIRH